MVIFTHIPRSDIMTWEDILKRKRRREEEPPKDYGFKRYDYAGAAEAARKKREAILNDPEIKEKARINRLKASAEKKISLFEDSIKAMDKGLDGYTRWPDKPKEQEAAIDWQRTKDAVSANILDQIEENEKRRAYVKFLKNAIKSNFKGITDDLGGLYNIGSEDAKFEGTQADIGNITKVIRAKYNEIARRLNWETMGQ